MQVEPNSTIQLYKNIPLNVGYEHTIYFSTESQQESYFSSLAQSSLLFSQQSYQRVSKGVLRIKARYTNVYGVNYMRFKNAGIQPYDNTTFNPYLDKWFYAFVLKSEYINEEVCELTYVLDVMQTWFFDVKLNPCYVEREHTDNDAIGANLLPEPVHTGEYQYTEVGKNETPGSAFYNFYRKPAYYVLTSADIDPQTGLSYPVGGQVVNGVYCGLEIKTFTGTNAVTQLNDYLVAMATANVSDRIVAIYTAPESFNAGTSSPIHMLQQIPKDTSWTYPETINGVTTTRPHNNKLYTAPFSLLHAMTPDGATHDYFYEYFNTIGSPNFAVFYLSGVASGQPEMQLLPVDYKGADQNYNERMVYNGWPMNAWSIDAYRAWLAQNQGRMNIQGVSGTIDFVGNLAGNVVSTYMAGRNTIESEVANAKTDVGAAFAALQKASPINTFLKGLGTQQGAAALTDTVGSAVDYGTQVAYLLNENKVASTRGGEAKGSPTSAIDLANGTNYIHFYAVRVNNYYASMIDDYFDRYGYACKRIKVPNRNVREHWTYTKTIGCQIEAKQATGGIPEDDRRAIEYIYDKGITFWRCVDGAVDVGNYLQDPDGNPIG